MRKTLAKLDASQRQTFTGKLTAIGYKQTYGHFLPTFLLTDVKYGNQVVTDHLWFNYGKQMTDLGMLQFSDRIQFTGRIKPYYKGYYPQRILDYKINNPRSLKLVETDLTVFRPAMPNVKTDKNALIGYIMDVNKTFYLKNGRPYDSWYVQQYRNWQKDHRNSD